LSPEANRLSNSSKRLPGSPGSNVADREGDAPPLSRASVAVDCGSVSAGFKDADLFGVPLRVAVGARSLEEGKLEVK
jgi:hypothetical protein